MGGVVTAYAQRIAWPQADTKSARGREAAPRGQSWGRLDDLVDGTVDVFPSFDDVVFSHRQDEVADVLRHVEHATNAGQWAYGFIAYDAAAGLDQALPAVSPDAADVAGSALPLVWFGLAPPPLRSTELVARRSAYRAGPWTHHWTQSAYGTAFDRVKDTIAAGRTYQCNLTTTLTAPFVGDPLSFYADLAHAQASRYCAYLEIDNHVIASASPELFFEWVGNTLRTKPMKGTAPRGRSPADDRTLLRELLDSPKERAENIIIVDLLRNDLAKVAAVGSVRVAALLTPEAYPTVWQLTSEVTAEPLPGTGLVAILRAMFPCGSVTGAPKAETMHIIQEVEARRRGIYCGAIGWVAPPSEIVRARFNVAIRTAHIDLSRGTCEYGVGSGITWSSEAAAELAELRAKRQILANTHWADQQQLAGRH
jgi:para-aminobenzoate synthetase / 4-amino-4-deoxychorismate lyase